MEHSASRDHFERVNGEAWIIEMNSSPAGLLRKGWASETLTPDMPITSTIRPLRDGSNGGQFLTATLPDGRLMDGDGGRRYSNSFAIIARSSRSGWP
jgi:hypothetical protein